MATKISKALSSIGARTGPRVYPNEPTPLHPTQSFITTASATSPPAGYESERRRRRRRRGFTCCSILAVLCSVLLLLVFLLGVAVLIAWLVLRPIHAPNYSLENVQLKTFSVSPQNTLDADVVYSIRADNPNGKIGFKYGAVEVDTSYGRQVFGRSDIPAFSQGHRNVTTLTSHLVVDNYTFVPASVGISLATDVRRGSVVLHARGGAKVRAKLGAITTFAVTVYVDCDLTVKPPTARSLGSVISKTCKLSR